MIEGGRYNVNIRRIKAPSTEYHDITADTWVMLKGAGTATTGYDRTPEGGGDPALSRSSSRREDARRAVAPPREPLGAATHHHVVIPCEDRLRERAERVHISCPGCGRHDWVRWPLGQEIYHWKCFNCGKEFDLTREGDH